MLSDKTIKAYGEALISPFSKKRVQPASYDLSLEKDLYLGPGESAIVSTLEKVLIPRGLAGEVCGKSSIARLSVSVENAGHVDPGFRGQITLEMYNYGKKEVRFHAGDPICQILFFELDTEAEKPYNGHYQNQKGATPSYLEKQVLYRPPTGIDGSLEAVIKALCKWNRDSGINDLSKAYETLGILINGD